MVIKKINLKQLLILLQFIPLYSLSQHPFIENKGQLPNQVEAKVLLPGGALFIESDKLTYNFYDQRSFSEAHNNYTLETLNAHSYKVEYLNSKKNSEFIKKILLH